MNKEMQSPIVRIKSIVVSPSIDHGDSGVQFGGDEIVKAKAGAGSATTCMAYAGFRYE